MALGFFLLGCWRIGDFGLTWDAPESYQAGIANLQIVRQVLGGDLDFEWPWHELTSFQFVFDSLRAATAVAMRPLLPEASSLGGLPIAGFHLFNLLLSSASVWLIGLVVLELGGAARLAALASIALASMPKLIGHAVNNPKDVIGLFVFLLVVWATLRAARVEIWSAWALAGLVLGLGLASHLTVVFAVVLLMVWILGEALLDGNDGRARRLAERSSRLAVQLAVGGLSGLLLWPWLWPSPLSRLHEALELVRRFDVGMKVLYLGELYERSDPPWHYLLVSLLVATPLLHLAAATVGGVAVLSRRSLAAGDRRCGLFALLWAADLLVADQLATAHYDGVRHFLPLLPALAVLSALGIERVWSLVVAPATAGARLWSVRLLTAGLVLASLSLAWQLATIHPYEDAYLNEAVNAFSPGPTEGYFELEYWASSYREGARWLNRNAPDGAVILVPFAAPSAAPYLRPDLELVEKDRLRGASEPYYLMLITRLAFFTRPLRNLGHLQPVFEIDRQRATLLRIYRVPGAA